MRHILVHAYYKVDLDAVWRVVAEHVPQMVPLLEQALKDWQPPEAGGEQGAAGGDPSADQV